MFILHYEYCLNIIPYSPANDASGTANKKPGPHLLYYAQEAQKTWYTPYLEMDHRNVRVPPGNGLGMEFKPDVLPGDQKQQAHLFVLSFFYLCINTAS